MMHVLKDNMYYDSLVKCFSSDKSEQHVTRPRITTDYSDVHKLVANEHVVLRAWNTEKYTKQRVAARGVGTWIVMQQQQKLETAIVARLRRKSCRATRKLVVEVEAARIAQSLWSTDKQVTYLHWWLGVIRVCGHSCELPTWGISQERITSSHYRTEMTLGQYWES